MHIIRLIRTKHVLGFILVSVIILFITIATSNPVKDGPSQDIKDLDAILLLDLRQQEINIDGKSKCGMDCMNINASELKEMFAVENANYSKCEPGNCHITSYNIEGELKKGNAVSFKLDCGEDGNTLKELAVENNNCYCI